METRPQRSGARVLRGTVGGLRSLRLQGGSRGGGQTFPVSILKVAFCTLIFLFICMFIPCFGGARVPPSTHHFQLDTWSSPNGAAGKRLGGCRVGCSTSYAERERLGPEAGLGGAPRGRAGEGCRGPGSGTTHVRGGARRGRGRWRRAPQWPLPPVLRPGPARRLSGISAPAPAGGASSSRTAAAATAAAAAAAAEAAAAPGAGGQRRDGAPSRGQGEEDARGGTLGGRGEDAAQVREIGARSAGNRGARVAEQPAFLVLCLTKTKLGRWGLWGGGGGRVMLEKTGGA